jgi:hypothetical protein
MGSSSAGDDLPPAEADAPIASDTSSPPNHNRTNPSITDRPPIAARDCQSDCGPNDVSGRGIVLTGNHIGTAVKIGRGKPVAIAVELVDLTKLLADLARLPGTRTRSLQGKSLARLSSSRDVHAVYGFLASEDSLLRIMCRPGTAAACRSRSFLPPGVADPAERHIPTRSPPCDDASPLPSPSRRRSSLWRLRSTQDGNADTRRVMGE